MKVLIHPKKKKLRIVCGTCKKQSSLLCDNNSIICYWPLCFFFFFFFSKSFGEGERLTRSMLVYER
jgi:hypothetical protein